MAEEDPAEVAFAALGLKVDGLSLQLSRLEKIAKRSTVDYAPTLATLSADMNLQLTALQALVRTPVLQLTCEDYRADHENVRARVRSDMQKELQQARSELHAAAADVKGALAQARTREVQDWWIVGVGTGALIAGVLLWAAASGPVARSLPRSWRAPEAMAAATLGVPMWNAGQQLMSRASPPAWSELRTATSLAEANHDVLAECQRQAKRLGRVVHCIVKVGAPSGD